jgi:hypothetical protein
MSSISITLDLFNKKTKLLARAIYLAQLYINLDAQQGKIHDIKNIKFAVYINVL